MDHPRVGGVPLVACPRVEPYKQGGFPNRTPIFCLVFDIMLLSEHVTFSKNNFRLNLNGIGTTISIGQRVSVSRKQDFLISGKNSSEKTIFKASALWVSIDLVI